MKNLLVLGILFLGSLVQANPLVCQGFDSQGKLIPVEADIYLRPGRTAFGGLGITVLKIQGVSHEFHSFYALGNASTRCVAGPTLDTEIQDQLTLKILREPL